LKLSRAVRASCKCLFINLILPLPALGLSKI
jgi:hypothetical protein